MQLILSGVERRDNWLKAFAVASGGILTRNWDGESIPVVVGNLNGTAEIQIECRKRGTPYVLVDHAYWNRDFNLGNARVCVSNYHCTDWRTSDRLIPSVQPYKQGKAIIVIPPAPYIQKIYNAHNWTDETVAKLKTLTDRPIVVKNKGEGELAKYLAKAHALVSFGSVSEVEAAIAGVPVFTSEYSPAVPISQDIAQIETPSYPDREQWLRALAASQWRITELDKCWERLNERIQLQRVTDSGCQLAASV